jgi:histone H1/5
LVPKAATLAYIQSTKTIEAMTKSSYNVMIAAAIVGLKARGGASRPALKKYILENNKDISLDAFERSLRTAIKKGVASGEIVQTKQKLIAF